MGPLGDDLVIHEGSALLSGMSALIKEPRKLPCPFCHVRSQQEDPLCEPGNALSPDTKFASALSLDFLGSRAVRKKFLLFINHPIYGILLYQSERTMTTCFFLSFKMWLIEYFYHTGQHGSTD